MKQFILALTILSSNLLLNTACESKKQVATRIIEPAKPALDSNVDKNNGKNSGEAPPGGGAAPVPSTEIKNLSRIFCERDVLPGMTLATLRSDANEQQFFAEITFEENGSRLNNILAPIVLSTVTNTSDLIFQQKQGLNGATTRLLRSRVSIPDRTGQASQIYKFNDLGDNLGSLESWGLSNSKILVSEINQVFLAPSADFTSYQIHSLNEPEKTLSSWNLSPQKATPVLFSPQGDFVVFYSAEQKTNQIQIRLKVARRDSPNIQMLATADNDALQLAPVFSSDTSLYWLEKSSQRLLLRWVSLTQLDQTKTLAVLNDSALSLIAYSTSSNGSNQDQIYFFSDSSLHVMTIDSVSNKVIMEKKFEMPSYIKDLAKRITTVWPNKLLSLPWTKQIFISLNGVGGAILFDINQESWSLSGITNPSNRCANPVSGLEVVSTQVSSRKAIESKEH